MRPYCITIAVLTLAFLSSAGGQEKDAGAISVGEGKITLAVPQGWQKKEPANRIVEAELAVPPVKGDETAGRLTAMGATGTVQANIDRWVEQFGGTTKPKIDKTTVSGAEIQVVDLDRTY